MSEDIIRLLAMWALLHELADEAWKAAVARGSDESGPKEPIDALASLVDEEKERLKAALAEGDAATRDLVGSGQAAAGIARLETELGQLRGRLESIEAKIDAFMERMAE